MINFVTKQCISVQDWDELVVQTYEKPYMFQQQDGCKERGVVSITIPDVAFDYDNDTIPEVINGEEMGVSFKAWLERHPKEWNGQNNIGATSINLFWERNFYPHVQMIANDLYEKGLIPAGKYQIEIDW